MSLYTTETHVVTGWSLEDVDHLTQALGARPKDVRLEPDALMGVVLFWHKPLDFGEPHNSCEDCGVPDEVGEHRTGCIYWHG